MVVNFRESTSYKPFFLLSAQDIVNHDTYDPYQHIIYNYNRHTGLMYPKKDGL